MSEKGYKVKITGASHKYKLPFFCPSCERLTGTIDDEWLLSLGICKTCVVMHIEGRNTPTIDLSVYAPPGGMFEGMSRSEIESFLSDREK